MNIFLTAFNATLKIFILIIAGYLLFKIKYIKKIYSPLLFYTVNIAIPILIIYRFMNYFKLNLLINSLFLPLYALLLLFIGYYTGKKLSNILNLPDSLKNHFVATLMFSNSGYYPLPLFQMIFKNPEQVALSQIYIFFFAIPYTSLIWSLGVNMLSNTDDNFKIQNFKLTPPFYAILIGIIFSFLNLKKFLFLELDRIIKLVSDTSSLLIMFLMGGGLAVVNLSKLKIEKSAIVITLLRLVALPAFIIIFLLFFKIDLILRTVILVEAGVPPAVNLVIITQKYGKNRNIDFLLSVIMLSYVLAILTVPLLILISQKLL